jgi:hypothetical protein
MAVWSRGGDGPADGELAGHTSVTLAADGGQERLGAAGAVGADQDRLAVPVGIRHLGQSRVEDGDVVGGSVGAGIARPQDRGEELAGVVVACTSKVPLHQVDQSPQQAQSPLVKRHFLYHAGRHADPLMKSPG